MDNKELTPLEKENLQRIRAIVEDMNKRLELLEDVIAVMYIHNRKASDETYKLIIDDQKRYANGK